MIFCFDIDGTISTYPVAMSVLMQGIQAAGGQVVVLSGHTADTATEDAIAEKQQLLSQLGCDHYTELVVVANPKNKVADLKVAYMRQRGADVLVDDNHDNIRAARKAGFLALRPGRT